jgi:hypothetical protein
MEGSKPTPACECKPWDPDWKCPVHGRPRPTSTPRKPRKPRDPSPHRVVRGKTAG